MNNENVNNVERENKKDVVIILPGGTPQIKKITIFMLGVCAALMFCAYINFNESLVLLVLGIVLFLLIFDEGFRRLF